MTAEAWDKCQDLGPMLRCLSGKASNRKLRLFASSCVRRVWHLLGDERTRRAVEVAERYADGLATDDELRLSCEGGDYPSLRARLQAEAEGDAPNSYSPIDLAYLADFHYLPRVCDALDIAAKDAARFGGTTHAAEQAAQCALLRCIFGNPFRPPIVFPSAMLAHNDGALMKLATVIYDGRRWDELPLLADALEECGCTDQAVLDHLRGPGPHARGCFVVDALTGR
jgi:hypothetical protein